MLLASLLLAGNVAYAASPTPILLELFTSEGCSSCPPVDAWVNHLDATQGVPGAQLIVLSEHVNYWDHQGWRDPYSSAALTERQHEYQTALGRDDVYTPQVILDGDVEVLPWKPQQVNTAFASLAAARTLPVRIEVSTRDPGFVAGKIIVDGAAAKRSGDVWVALALDRAQSQVTAGENNGRRLTHVAVVRDLVHIGTAERGSNFAQNFRVKLWPGADAAKLRIVAFVQDSGLGRVEGAAMVKTGKGAF